MLDSVKKNISALYGMPDVSLGKTYVSRDKIALSSVEWLHWAIMDDRYDFSESDIRDWETRVLSCLNKGCSTETRISVLTDFAESFVNNPYCYENRWYKKDKGSAITSKILVCYFVKCAGIPVPIGMLKDLLGISVNDILAEFLTAKNIKFRDDLWYNKEVCKNMGEQVAVASDGKGIVWRLILGFVLFVAALVYGYERFISAVDWSRITEVLSSGANIFQICGILTEHTYGFNVNSSLPMLFLIIGLLWLHKGLKLLSSTFRDLKTYRKYSKGDNIKPKIEELKDRLEEILSEHGHREAFIEEYKTELDTMILEAVGGTRIDKLATMINKANPVTAAVEQGSAPLKKIKRGYTLPKTGKLMFLVLLFVITCVFGVEAKSDEFINRYNTYSKKIYYFIDGMKLRGTVPYCVAAPTQVYTSPDEKGIGVYTVNPNIPIEILENTEDTDSGYHIKIDSETGYIKGWIKECDLYLYNPINDLSVRKLMPDETTASSGTDKVDNLLRESVFVTWSADDTKGVGEIIQYGYQEAAPVKLFRFKTGFGVSKWHYNRYSRPTAFTIELYHQGSLVGSVPVQISDMMEGQFICLNKSVTADKIRFVVNTVASGEKSEKMYMTELSVYGLDN